MLLIRILMSLIKSGNNLSRFDDEINELVLKRILIRMSRHHDGIRVL